MQATMSFHRRQTSYASQYAHLPVPAMRRNTRPPVIELDQAVYTVEFGQSYCTITGEVEIDLSLFLTPSHELMTYSIGLALSTSDPSGSDSSPILEWNQDGPGNYNRPKSFIRIHKRLIVDLSCFVKFTIRLPAHLLPQPGKHRLFSLGVKAYALDNAYVAAQPASAEIVAYNPANNGRRGSVGKL